MADPPVPSDERDRLAKLRAYGILDTETEEAFDRIARIAATACRTPVALVTLVDEDRQWFKACVAVDHRETDRSISFCAHAILDPEQVTYVPDALEDPRFADNPQVTGDPRYRFYAGAPIISPEGHALGTVCVLADEPRELDDDQLSTLHALADQVADLLEPQETDGVGIGLTIARRIVENHGGAIHADSEPDRGSTFTLPAADR